MTRSVGEGATVADEATALVGSSRRVPTARRPNPARDSHPGWVLARPGHAPDGEQET
ncbi:hypothetical protein BKA21_002353 [Cellulomonas oligotrophica]|uniref:Uncharacterized protein n=1 Tax=Cellulomonas oligotrophica TaxID=931536 RepID=A0A7Y9FGG8_9CELL|nr:hypothetical protein [Cellulomonas oligotrophica]